MTATALLADLLSRGVGLSADGDRLHVDAPKGVLTDADVAALHQHKPQILAILSARFCPWCDALVKSKAISAVSGLPLFWCYIEGCGWCGTWPREKPEVSR